MLALLNKNKWCALGILILTAIGIGGCAVILSDAETMSIIRAECEELFAYLQSSPLIFYIALAILPSLGAPMSVFYLTAPAMHDDSFMLPLIGCSIALLSNSSIGFWLAKGIGRPIAIKLMAKLGYKVPEIPKDQEARAVLLLRITPGLPYCIQNVILGLAGIGYWKYILVSWLVGICWIIAFLTLGKSIMEGNAPLIIFGVSLFVALILITRMIRKKANRSSKELLD